MDPFVDKVTDFKPTTLFKTGIAHFESVILQNACERLAAPVDFMFRSMKINQN